MVKGDYAHSPSFSKQMNQLYVIQILDFKFSDVWFVLPMIPVIRMVYGDECSKGQVKEEHAVAV